MPQKIHPWNTKHRPTVGRISCLAELGSRPIQAEPVHASIARAVRVDLASGPFSGMIAEDLAYKVGVFVEGLQELGRLNTGFDREGYDAQYAEGMNRIFAGVGGLQGGVWIPEDAGRQDGWSQSAFTVEDLPSDRFGAHFGASSSPLGRIQFWRGPDYWGPRLKEDIKSKFKGFLEGCGAVNLDGPSRKRWGGKLLTAGEVLHGDAQRMQDSIRIQANAGAGYDELVDGMTMAPKYLYNRSDKPKRTYSHDCVCDGDKPYRR